ncbi:MAG: hypothetical protein AAGI17_07895, partial [Planctomycetota bacterium]
EIVGDLAEVRSIERETGRSAIWINLVTIEEILYQLPKRIAHIRFFRHAWRVTKWGIPISVIAKLWEKLGS